MRISNIRLPKISKTVLAIAASGSLIFSGLVPAQAATIINGGCTATVDNTIDVKVYDSGTHCFVAFKGTDSNYTWTKPTGVTTVDLLVVAGGGGGGARHAGGGGAGGLLQDSGLTLTSTSLVVKVGAGGDGGPNTAGNGTSGQNSSVQGSSFSRVAIGGGYGGGGGKIGATGGSGGGGGGSSGVGGAGTDGQGFGGGEGGFVSNGTDEGWAGGGGGGAASAGTDASGYYLKIGSGGNGKPVSWITSAAQSALAVGETSGGSVYFAGGGAGGGGGLLIQVGGGIAGVGGGGASGGGTADANTGGGGGGGYLSGTGNDPGGDGGSGVVVIRYAKPALPTNAKCDGTSTQGGLTVTAGHGNNFYIDTGQGQSIDAGYLAYQVKSATARKDLWVEVSDFNGGVVSLANAADAAQPLGNIATDGASKTAFFMVKATKATTVAQSHIVRVYASKPSIGSPTPLYVCNFSFARVDETIKALANKVTSVTPTVSSTVIGSTLTVVVNGDTGTIGQGNDLDGRVIWLSPAAKSSWPTGSVRLLSTNIKFSTSTVGNSDAGEYNDVLRINASSTPALSSASRLLYRATYTFRIIGSAPSVASVVPVAMISSGTQIKHNDVSGIPGTPAVDLTTTTLSLKVNKNVSSSLTIAPDGTTVMDYTVSLDNTAAGSPALAVDQVSDYPDPALSFVPGSAKFGGVAISDPGQIEGGIAFSGPFEVAAGQKLDLTYKMVVETCRPGATFSYENTSVAEVGTLKVGSGSAKQSLVTLSGLCGSSTGNVLVEEIPMDPTITTAQATDVTQTSATINGIYDSNGVADLPVRFVWSTSPTLASPTVASVAASTDSENPVATKSDLTGLNANTTYYYAAQIQQADGTWVSGEIVSFTTPPVPAVPTVATDQPSSIFTTTAQLNGSIDPNLVTNGAKVRFELASSTVGTCSGVTSGSLLPGSSTYLQTEGTTLGSQVDAVFEGSGLTDFSFVAPVSSGDSYCYRSVAYYGAGPDVIYGAWVPFTATLMAAQEITWTETVNSVPAGGQVTLTTVHTGSEDSALIRYVSTDPNICTVSVDEDGGVVITPVATSGNCSITAYKDGVAGQYYEAVPQTITFAISPPVITTLSLPDGTYQSAYSQSLAATGGSGSYDNWRIDSGSLPQGLTLNPATGVISGTPTNAGIYEISVVTYSNGVKSEPRPYTLVIDKVVLATTASSHTLTYAASVPTITPSYTGFVAGDTQSSIASSPNILPTCSTAYLPTMNVSQSPQATSCSNGWAENYTFSYSAGTVTIQPLALTLTALDASKEAGADDPTSYGYSLKPTLPAGKSVTDALNAISITRAAGETPGTYVITPSTTAKTNYTVTLVNGTFTISEKKVPVLATTDSTIVYGTNLQGLLNATATENGSSVSGSFTYSYVDGAGQTIVLNSGSILNAGSYSVLATFTPNDTVRFEGPITKAFTITVTPLAVTVKALRKAKQNLVSSSGATSYTTVVPDPELEFALVTPLPEGRTLSDIFPNGAEVVRAGAGAPPGKYLTSNLPAGTSTLDERVAANYAQTLAGQANSNFAVTYVAADFVITEKIVPELTPTDHVITQGRSLRGLLDTTASHLQSAVPGSFVYSYQKADGTVIELEGPEVLQLGTYFLTVTFTPTDGTAYFGPIETLMTIQVIREVYVEPIKPIIITPTTTGGSKSTGNRDAIKIKPVVTNAGNQCLEDPRDGQCKSRVVIPKQGTWLFVNGVATFTPVKGFVGRSVVVHRVTNASGGVARANLVANYKGRPPRTITIPNFRDGSPAITASIARQITRFVNKYPDYKKIECVGYTEGPTILRTDKRLSMQRAINACSYVKNVLKGKFTQLPPKAGQDTVEANERRRVVITLTD